MLLTRTKVKLIFSELCLNASWYSVKKTTTETTTPTKSVKTDNYNPTNSLDMTFTHITVDLDEFGCDNCG